MKKRGKFNITYLRRFSQILFFILIVYGVFLLGQIADTFKIESEAISDITEANESISQTYRFVADYNLPVRSCSKAQDDNRFFQGCAMRLISEKATMGSLVYFLPQLLLILALMLIFGRMLCGWVCPLGFISEIFSWIRRKLKINSLRLPRKTIDFMNKFKYYLLSFIIVASIAVTLPIIGEGVVRKEFYQLSCQFCPSKVIFGLLPGGWNLYLDFTSPLFIILTVISIIFFAMIVLSFFIDRFWCRLCPNGALISLFNKSALFKKEKDLKKCTKCAICKRVCPIDNLTVYEEKEKEILNTEDCIMCMECVKYCPEDDCLKLKFLGKTLYSSKFEDKKKNDNKKKK